MKSVERKGEISSIARQWQKSFREGALVIGKMDGKDVLWHQRLGIWGCFGKTHGKGGKQRDWNAFGQRPSAFRQNLIVEINQPPSGVDTNLQAVFAHDQQGQLWLMHQGRMSIPSARVTETDFADATGITPTRVQFGNGETALYHPVTRLNVAPAVMQEGIGAFIAQCARARTAKAADGVLSANLNQAQDWERGFSPEKTGSYEVKAREAVVAERLHAEVHRSLAAELARRKVRFSNDRVGQYGPDLYTYGQTAKALFEIKSGSAANDVFAAVGQLHIYDCLLGGGYRKILVVPSGIGQAFQGPLKTLGIDTIEFVRKGRRTIFDFAELSRCLN
ncbi:hypothetical protein [Tsuneonella rigui]|uniref:hypothetical protein n=1 Tax=Tsuneonella rigui TaxID=1708790 RepID=UPI000F7EBC3D|nr:hypothetical protein [Tsuneonella rigui]